MIEKSKYTKGHEGSEQSHKNTEVKRFLCNKYCITESCFETNSQPEVKKGKLT